MVGPSKAARTRSSAGSGSFYSSTPTYIKPATSRLSGKIERSHRIDAGECYRLLDSVDIAQGCSTTSSRNERTTNAARSLTAPPSLMGPTSTRL